MKIVYTLTCLTIVAGSSAFRIRILSKSRQQNYYAIKKLNSIIINFFKNENQPFIGCVTKVLYNRQIYEYYIRT